MAPLIRWYRNATDPAPLVTEFRPDNQWTEGQALLREGRQPSLRSPSAVARYGNGWPDGLSRGMQGWGWEARGGAAASIVRALRGENATYQDFFDFLAEHGSGPGGFPPEDFKKFVGRPNPNAAPGSDQQGVAAWNPIILRSDPSPDSPAWDPDWPLGVEPPIFHGDVWQGRDLKWYALEDRTKGRGPIPSPLGGETSGGAGGAPSGGSGGVLPDATRAALERIDEAGQAAFAELKKLGLQSSGGGKPAAALRKLITAIDKEVQPTVPLPPQ